MLAIVVCCVVAYVFCKREAMGVGPHFQGSQQEISDAVVLLS